MKITINDHRKISAIEEEFNAVFPYLKIEFFSKTNNSGGSSSEKMVRHSITLGDCRTIHKKGHIIITPEMTVADLEKKFDDIYGVHIQVSRKSGKVWLETTVTEGWTLEEQNRQGEALSKFVV